MEKFIQSMVEEYGTSDGRNRKLLSGFGINDSPYVTQRVSDKWFCPHYRAWSGMVYRGYSPKCQEKRPTYQTCSVSQEWRYFTKFLEWSLVNYVEGWALDKDMLVQGNKVYGPENCAYIPDYINNLFIRATARTGKLPMGVRKTQSRSNPFHVSVGVGDNLSRYVGVFKTPEEAHAAWQEAKAESSYEALKRYTKEPRGFRTDVADSINCRIWQLLLDKSKNLETKVL